VSKKSVRDLRRRASGKKRKGQGRREEEEQRQRAGPREGKGGSVDVDEYGFQAEWMVGNADDADGREEEDGGIVFDAKAPAESVKGGLEEHVIVYSILAVLGTPAATTTTRGTAFIPLFR
jgi:hypothetical protein